MIGTEGGAGMKTLYVSDLDGTLLRSDETTSEYTNQVINQLTENGMLFSYATARSFVTSKKVTKGLNAKIPLIVYNGAFVVDNKTEEVLLSNYFGEEVKALLGELLREEIYPIVYSYIEGVEKFSFLPKKCTRGMNSFLKSREGDKRTNPVTESAELFLGNIFYLTCIDEAEKLKPFYEKYKEQYHCVYQKDIYTKEQWLEIMPLRVSKAAAIRQLKEYLHCDRVVAFGDGKNDIDMFEIADECYAVENAVEELKEMATGVIGNHDEDGVVKWLEEHWEGK